MSLNAPSTTAKGTPPLPVLAGALQSRALLAVRRLQLFGDPVTTTPGRLKAGLGLIWLLTGLYCVAVVASVWDYRKDLKTIGDDTAPSIIAAEHIKANLADMHSHAANLLLDKPGVNVAAAKDYERRRLEVVKGLLDAATNVTYGDAERVPLQILFDKLGTYQETVAQARTLHEKGDTAYLAKYREADRVHHQGLLPAADALDRANREELDHSYRKQRAAEWGYLAVLVTIALALLAALVLTQVFLYRRMRRRLNPALLAATVLAAGFLVWILTALGAAAAGLRLAKEDAFESIHALWLARADAFDANGEESRWLLDRAQAAIHEKGFREKVTRIAKPPEGKSLTALAAEVDKLKAIDKRTLPKGFTGYLADELGNLTFPGEREAAVDTLKHFDRYVAIDDEIRKLEKDGQHAAAVALCLGSKPGQSNWAFEQFDAAVGKVIDLNLREFDAAIAQGKRRLAGLEWWAVIVATGAAALAYFGLRPRLREYAL
jgi:hypothetical protein